MRSLSSNAVEKVSLTLHKKSHSLIGLKAFSAPALQYWSIGKYLRSRGSKRNMDVTFCLVPGLIQYLHPSKHGWTKINYKKK